MCMCMCHFHSPVPDLQGAVYLCMCDFIQQLIYAGIMLMQCSDVCPVDIGWDSSITANIRDARFIHITWMADTPTSLYVVQYRLRNTQVYTSSVEVRVPYCMCA